MGPILSALFASWFSLLFLPLISRILRDIRICIQFISRDRENDKRTGIGVEANIACAINPYDIQAMPRDIENPMSLVAQFNPSFDEDLIQQILAGQRYIGCSGKASLTNQVQVRLCSRILS